MGAGHHHHHGASSDGRARLAVTLALTTTVLVTQVVGAAWTGSLALLVDAAHMLTDSLGLVVALIAAVLMARPPSARRTWGWQRTEVIAAAAQASFLLVVGTYAIVEAVQRLIAPPQVAAQGLAVFGGVGLAANVLSLLVLAGGRGHNLNMRAAFLEVASDALGSVAVLVAAAVIILTGWQRADPVAGLVVATLIVPRALSLLRETGTILLESTPAGLDLDEVRRHLAGQPHVLDVHDLHASTIASGLPVLTAHVVLDEECFTDGHGPQLLDRMLRCLASHHELTIEHCTLQFETPSLAAHHAEHLHA
ncbi:cation diffusion facilitator family transporter [Arsenicicoccus dermatophilus]|uniref:cation diffusion facilitator family transporter n=1 Tax=Arsenicicoccus dermatophilus TaxID=1076331 RepID=UPI001F4D1C44|nr:cation diffusion facilitator family transporter [Arsenicicoccus dermatophilus]MCH8614178.1 cation diffusion facilitator family transporter [Arsenicicoccus dermatophilus]